MKRKACFIDRDGVLIEEKNYLSDPSNVVLIPGAVEAVKKLHAAGYLVIMISNQAGIAKGYFKPEDLQAVETKLDELLSLEGIALDGKYHCYHHPQGVVPEYTKVCECRKPAPGMLLRAVADFDLDPAECFMIGDRTSDLEAGFNAGCGAVAQVYTGHGTKEQFENWKKEHRIKTCEAASICGAVDQLLNF